MSLNERDLGRFFVEGLAAAVGELSGGKASHAPGAAPTGVQWTVTIASDGPLGATCVLAIDHEGVAALTLVVAAQETDAAIEGVLRDAMAETISAVLAREEASGLRLSVRSVTKGLASTTDTALSAAAVTAVGVPVPLHVGYYAVVAPAAAGVSGPTAGKRSMDDQQRARLDVILDIDLPVVVRFGHTEMPLRAVTRIAPGSVIELGRSPDDPVELLVSDRVVARGEVVVVGGNYGIRILDVVSPSERMRSLEA